MDKKTNTPAQKTFTQPQAHNDQLGENASEEYKSEKYTNSGDGKDKNCKRI